MVSEIARADFALKWLFLTFPTPKPMLGSKSFRRMTPPKVRFIRPNKVLGAQKSFFGPPETQKIDTQSWLCLHRNVNDNA